MRRLVALDLDGTLLTYESTLPEGHARAIRELTRRGILVAIATGRTVTNARWVGKALGLTTPLIAFNGGWVGVPDHPPLAQLPLTGAETREILAALADLDGTRCAYPDAYGWWIDRDDRIGGWRSVYHCPITCIPEAFEAWEGPSHKVMFVTDPDLLEHAAKTVRARLGGRFQVVVSQHDRFEIMPFAVTKAWGLARLADHLGVHRDNVWAVGDADNDLEMIAWAGHGVVMGQAHPRIHRHARHVLPGIQARGLCALPLLMDRHG